MNSRFVTRLEGAYDRLQFALGYAVAISIGLFAVSISIEWLLLRIGAGGLPWLTETIEYVLYAGVFLAAPWVLREGAHVRVDVLLSAVPRGVAFQMERILDIAGAVICFGLCYYGIRATLDAYVSGAKQYKTMTIDTWWLMAIFAFAMFVLGIEFLVRLRRAAVTPEEEREAVKSGAGF